MRERVSFFYLFFFLLDFPCLLLIYSCALFAFLNKTSYLLEKYYLFSLYILKSRDEMIVTLDSTLHLVHIQTFPVLKNLTITFLKIKNLVQNEKFDALI